MGSKPKKKPIEEMTELRAGSSGRKWYTQGRWKILFYKKSWEELQMRDEEENIKKKNKSIQERFSNRFPILDILLNIIKLARFAY